MPPLGPRPRVKIRRKPSIANQVARSVSHTATTVHRSVSAPPRHLYSPITAGGRRAASVRLGTSRAGGKGRLVAARNPKHPLRPSPVITHQAVQRLLHPKPVELVYNGDPQSEQHGLDKFVMDTVRPPLVKAVDIAGRPYHAEFGAIEAGIKGKNIQHAAARGLEGKEHKSGYDVLGALGVKNKVVKTVGGLGLDIALDPTTHGRGALVTRGAEKGIQKEADRAAAKAADHLRRAHQATVRGDTEAAAKAIRQGTKHLKKLRRAEEEAKDPTRGVSVGLHVKVPFKEKPILDVKTSGRSTAAVARRVKRIPAVKRTGENIRTGMHRTVSPATTPPFRTRAEHRAVRQAQQQQRGAQAVAEHSAERHFNGFVEAVPSVRDREAIGHAIETQTIHKLSKEHQAVALEHKARLDAALKEKQRTGLLKEGYKPQGPGDPPGFVPHVNMKNLDKSGEARFSGGTRPGMEHRRQLPGTRREKNARVPGQMIEDTAVAGAIHLVNAGRKVSRADMWRQIIDRTGKPFHAGSDLSNPHARVYEVTPRGPKAIEEYGGYRDLAAEARILAGSHPPGRYVVMDKRSVEAVENTTPQVDPHSVGRVYDKFQGAVKHAMTVNPLNPGFQLRNFTGDEMLGWLADTSVISNVQANSIRRTIKLRNRYEASKEAASGADSALKQRAEKALNMTVKVGNKRLTRREVIDGLEQHGAINAGQYGSEVRNQIGGVRVKTNKVIHRGRIKIKDQGHVAQFNQARENYPRTATYLSGLKRGMSPEDAASHSLGSHIDYGERTAFERNAASRLLPFYTFFARNTAIQAKNVLAKPGKLATLAKVYDTAARTAGFDGYQQYVSSLPNQEQRGLPFPLHVNGHVYPVFVSPPQTDINGLTLSPQDQMQNVLNRVTFLKMIPELALNYSIFFQGPIRTGDRLVPAPAGVELLPDFLKKRLGVGKIVDKKSGKTIWGWDAKVDYASRFLPQSNFAISAAKPVPDARGLNGILRAASFATGIKVGPDKRGDNKLNGLYDSRQKISDRLDRLRQAGYSADRSSPEYRKLTQQQQDLDRQIYQRLQQRGDKVLPSTGAPPKQKSGDPFAAPDLGKDPYDTGPSSGDPFSGKSGALPPRLSKGPKVAAVKYPPGVHPGDVVTVSAPLVGGKPKVIVKEKVFAHPGRQNSLTSDIGAGLKSFDTALGSASTKATSPKLLHKLASTLKGNGYSKAQIDQALKGKKVAQLGMPAHTDKGVVERAAKSEGVPPELLWGVYGAETNYGQNHNDSGAGAEGPFQFMPGTADSYVPGGRANVHDFPKAAKGAAKLLGRLLKKYHGNQQLAAAAYNAGEGAVDKYGGVPPYAETQNYVRTVAERGKTFGGGDGGRPVKGDGGRIVAIPARDAGHPGEEAAKSVISKIDYAHKHFGVGVSDAFDRDHSAGHKSPGHNVTGTAVDFTGTPKQTDELVKWAVKQGYTVYYDGRFGSTALAGHGPGNHAHVEFPHAGLTPFSGGGTGRGVSGPSTPFTGGSAVPAVSGAPSRGAGPKRTQGKATTDPELTALLLQFLSSSKAPLSADPLKQAKRQEHDSSRLVYALSQPTRGTRSKV